MERSAKRHFWIKWTSLDLVCVGRYKYVVISSTHYTLHRTDTLHRNLSTVLDRRVPHERDVVGVSVSRRR